VRPADLASARSVAVYGYGREGRSLVRHVRRHAPGADLVLVQDGPADDELTEAAEDGGFEVVTGDGVAEVLTARPFDVILRSPGVSIHHGPLRAAIEAGRDVTTGLNLWFAEHRPDNVIAITGTKGKSTTTTVIAHLLRRAGRDVLLAGNIGLPVLDLDRRPESADHVVLELSSYQLADLDAELALGVLLNLHPEHVDWHGDHDQYADDKCRIIELSRVLVVNGDDRELAARAAGHPDPRWFSVAEREVRAGSVALARDDLHDALDRSELTGLHQQWNVAAALATVAEVGVPADDALDFLADVVPLPHRLQVVADDGRRWVDDSISTIPEAAVAALRAFPDDPVTLLAGGYDRQQDHAVLVAAARAHGRVRVITMPDTGVRFADDLRTSAPDVEVHEAADLEAAVARAAAITARGGVILLSPAAPSYGNFRSFEERGDRFAELASTAEAPA